MKDSIFNRYNIFAFLVIAFFLVVIIRLFNLQIVHGNEFSEKSKRRILKERVVYSPRGEIFDRNYVPVAENRKIYTVNIINTKLGTENLNRMLLDFSILLEKNDDSYLNKFEKYLKINPFEYGDSLQTEESVVNFKKDITNKEKDIEMIKSPRDLFNYLKDEKYFIDEKYTDKEAYKIMSLRHLITGFTALDPVTIAKDISLKSVAEIEEKNAEFPGININIEYAREYYSAKWASHVIGYVGAMGEKTYERLKNEGYSMNDTIGISGVESSAEIYLKGRKGKKRVEEDIWGRQIEEWGGDPAIPGSDVILTIDMNLQKTALESLEENINIIKSKKDNKRNFGDAFAGAAVAIDVNTGEVLVLASYPYYDPSVFVANPGNKETEQKINELKSDSVNAPLFNRAVQGTYAPGSTFKPLVAIAALEEDIIKPQTIIYDRGVYRVGNMRFTCLDYMGGRGHGNINVSDALKVSCNYFFYKVGVDTGINNIDKWAKIFGFGKKTGIDVYAHSENTGLIADPETKKQKVTAYYNSLISQLEKQKEAIKETYENDDSINKEDYEKELININEKIREYKNQIVYEAQWFPADTAQASIGQLYNSFTPLQLANYVATIANGGKHYTPYIIKKVIKHDKSIVKETMPVYNQIPLENDTIEAVKKGMVASANAIDGTAVHQFKDFEFVVASKTGTAETGEENSSSNGLFICYAPADNPEIAVAVVIEKGVWGSYSAPVARDILAEYFNIYGNKNKSEEIIPEGKYLIE